MNTPTIGHYAAEEYDGTKDIQAMRKRTERSEWIPVSDRLPERNKDVLVWFTGMVHIACHIDGWQVRGFHYSFKTAKIDFWMPLPEPPKI